MPSAMLSGGRVVLQSVVCVCRWGSPEHRTPDPRRRPSRATTLSGAAGGRSGRLALATTALEPHKGKAQGASLWGKGSLRHVPCHLSVPRSYFKVPTTCSAGPLSGNKKASNLPGSQSPGQGDRSPEVPASSPARDRDLGFLTRRPAERLLLSDTDVRPWTALGTGIRQRDPFPLGGTPSPRLRPSIDSLDTPENGSPVTVSGSRRRACQKGRRVGVCGGRCFPHAPALVLFSKDDRRTRTRHATRSTFLRQTLANERPARAVPPQRPSPRASAGFCSPGGDAGGSGSGRDLLRGRSLAGCPDPSPRAASEHGAQRLQTGRPRPLHGPRELGRPSSRVPGCGFHRSDTRDLLCLMPPGAGLSELRSRRVQFHGVRPASPFVKGEGQSRVRRMRDR